MSSSRHAQSTSAGTRSRLSRAWEAPSFGRRPITVARLSLAMPEIVFQLSAAASRWRVILVYLRDRWRKFNSSSILLIHVCGPGGSHRRAGYGPFASEPAPRSTSNPSWGYRDGRCRGVQTRLAGRFCQSAPGRGRALRDAVVRAARIRMRPIIMTARRPCGPDADGDQAQVRVEASAPVARAAVGGPP